jgi:L-alanine-DL-glutamate epimerase-like enolase superfamily enzyme
MKIKDIKLHLFKDKVPVWVTSTHGLFPDSGPAGQIEFSLVRVITDEDIEGDYIVWSEIPMARPGALAEVLRAWKPHIVGEDPFNREKIWQKLSDFWYRMKGPALSAIDCALWDIAGKATQKPIYQLLGAYRHKVLAYASGCLAKATHPQEHANHALKLKEKGYKAMKIHPISIEDCSKIREAVGDEIVLMHDSVFAYTREQALSVGKCLEELKFYWYEAPLPPDDMEGYKQLTKALEIPVTVEVFNHFLEYIRGGMVDIFRSMCGFTGGITELKKIASLCEYYGMNLEPHSYGGAHYQMMHLHLILAIKNCQFFEIPLSPVTGEEGYFDIGIEGTGIRIDKDGFVHAPQKPGLGLDIDWDLLKRGEEIKI